MLDKTIAKGAEAEIILRDNIIIKKRIPKGYRQKELDERIRKSRTKKEAKILEKAIKIINCPKILNLESIKKYPKETSIEMEYIEGDTVSKKLNDYPKEKQNKVMEELGQMVAKLHKEDIIHGDLTTSNVILKQDKIFIIDFGLGFISKRVEDKAVDLHLIKQALEAKHWQSHEELFEKFIKGYKKDYLDSLKILEQLIKVESRGRYKH